MENNKSTTVTALLLAGILASQSDGIIWQERLGHRKYLYACHNSYAVR